VLSQIAKQSIAKARKRKKDTELRSQIKLQPNVGLEVQMSALQQRIQDQLNFTVRERLVQRMQALVKPTAVSYKKVITTEIILHISKLKIIARKVVLS
jgi:hypothetical protein